MPREFSVLHVEDDPNDVFFLQEAFKKVGLDRTLRTARDGEEAVAYLLGQGAHADRAKSPLPSLILLDLKLPKKSGLEVLEWRREQKGLRFIPVVVLTSSQSNEDMARAYELGANSYLVKPIDSLGLLAIAQAVCGYWRDLNLLPDVRPANGA